MTADETRSIALSFEGAVEQDHHGRPSFRVGGKNLPLGQAALVEPLLAEAWQRRA